MKNRKLKTWVKALLLCIAIISIYKAACLTYVIDFTALICLEALSLTALSVINFYVAFRY